MRDGRWSGVRTGEGPDFGQVVAEGWPSTLGRAWDWSPLTFPATELPVGSGVAELRLFDAGAPTP